MGQLTDFTAEATGARQKESAGQLINSVTKLKTQYANTNTLITNLKAKIKSDVAGNNWIPGDIASLAEALNLLQGIKGRAQARRQEILGMQLLLTDTTHKAELQSEIDNLNIPV